MLTGVIVRATPVNPMVVETGFGAEIGESQSRGPGGADERSEPALGMLASGEAAVILLLSAVAPLNLTAETGVCRGASSSQSAQVAELADALG